jgi:hypothetical protein
VGRSFVENSALGEHLAKDWWVGFMDMLDPWPLNQDASRLEGCCLVVDGADFRREVSLLPKIVSGHFRKVSSSVTRDKDDKMSFVPSAEPCSPRTDHPLLM